MDKANKCEAKDAKQLTRILSKTTPWVIGSSVLVYLIWRIQPRPLIDAMSHAQLLIYIPALIVFVYLSFLVDTQNLQALMKSFGYAFSFAESRTIRGASYLIMVVDYTLGMGSIVYFFNKTKQISLLRGTAIMLYYNYINQMALALLAIAGYPLLGRWIPWLTKGLLVCLLLIFITVAIIGILKHSNHILAMKLKGTVLAQSFAESSAKTYFINIIYRMGYYFSYVVFFYAAVRAFAMDIPFTTLVAYVPIILLVISIPVSPFGLGTSQATMLFLFKDYGSQPQILAFSLAYTISLLVLRAVLGTYYYGIMTKSINLQKELREGGYSVERTTDGETA